MQRNQIDILKKVLREKRMEREALNGRPRSHTWGGRPEATRDRRTSRKELRAYVG